MASMGFSHHPGPLPFVTIRDAKWANRLTNLGPLRIHGEHGCDMPRQIALVAKVAPYTGSRSLIGLIYPDGRPLVAVHLEQPTQCPVVHAWDHEWGMCAHCGTPEPQQ